jgi:hypothetical protein
MFNGVGIFAISLLLAIAMSVAVLCVLRRSLRSILSELCANESHARFWLQLAAIWLVLIPAIATMFHSVNAGAVPEISAALQALIERLRTAMIGILAALVVIAAALLHFISRR